MFYVNYKAEMMTGYLEFKNYAGIDDEKNHQQTDWDRMRNEKNNIGSYNIINMIKTESGKSFFSLIILSVLFLKVGILGTVYNWWNAENKPGMKLKRLRVENTCVLVSK